MGAQGEGLCHPGGGSAERKREETLSTPSPENWNEFQLLRQKKKKGRRGRGKEGELIQS